MERIILHVDMDAFFASVEVLDNPNLRGKPVIVGGVGERGVVSTCSYEARKYGIHSAMPAFIASKKCPMGIFLPVRMSRYKEISEKVFNILKSVTLEIEPLSIDEAFLDITNSNFKNGLDAAKYIKQRVKKEVGLTISVGISYNKFLAKLASDWNKPNGIMIINKDMVPDILLPLSVGKIFGLGKKAVSKLNNIGIFTIQDLYEMPKEFYLEYLGKNGLDIYDRIRGIDNRKVNVSRERKSIGRERTLRVNTLDKEELFKYLSVFSVEISKMLEKRNASGKTITLKYKTASFVNHTRSRTINKYIYESEDILNILKEMLDEEELNEELRLIGASISSFKENNSEQITFF